ncbi:hypothetical protein F443_21588 [Phytophthora nicotianae P1569]|uniref:Reverse transcriptase domain-containing protein n=1 Tax=Phytophthora nicotianae P1569 TaxID=1317065 RepID=V9DX81_PHYNI|nr:hypothetical protein F443_21588 [Phytophthora nicotianae P1569]
MGGRCNLRGKHWREDGTSTDAKSIPADLPALEYESVRRLAEKIEVLARQYPQLQVKVLKGDVKSAFGLIPVDAKLAAHFAGSCGGLAIVDMTLPFGWTGLPAHYSAFGGAISFLVARESPKSLDPIEQDDESFFSFVWVDDHILLEVDRGNRLALAETALRLSMIATLGPKSINEKKFSSWSTRLVALGLTCDTQRRTISIPADKVHKALNRISDALSHPTVSRHQVEKLLRSLRYLAICCRSTRAFLQRLHQLWRRSSRFQSIRLPQDARHDLRWVASLLQNGAANRVATSIMADTLEPAVHLFMDASNEGIAVLYPAAREYIRLQFDEEERLGMKLPTSGSTSWFSINIASSADMSIAQHRVIYGAALLGFFFCLRGSEYLCSRGKRHACCLQVGDVIVRDINGADTISFNKATSVQITLRGSKTDQSERTSTRVLLKSGMAPICLVLAALLLQRNAIQLKLVPESPLCSTGSRRVLSTDNDEGFACLSSTNWRETRANFDTFTSNRRRDSSTQCWSRRGHNTQARSLGF